MRSIVICLALLLLAPACPPSPSPPPAPDVVVVDAAPPPLDACSRACANLRTLGCPEGDDAGRCLDGCRAGSVVVAPKTVACWQVARSPDAARACGSLRCQR